MTTTSSISEYCLKSLVVASIAFNSSLSISASINYKEPQSFGNNLDEESTSSKKDHLPGEFRSWDEKRVAKIKALRGKYKRRFSTTDEFMKQKLQDIEIEG